MPPPVTQINGKVFLAYPDKLPFLLQEIIERFSIDVKNLEHSALDFTGLNIDVFPSVSSPCLFGSLVYIPQWTASKYPYWAACVMESPCAASFSSIKEAASVLKGIQRNWASYQYSNFRRSSLIHEALPYMNRKKKKFPCVLSQSPVGLFTLLGPSLMLYSSLTSSYMPSGYIELEEDHENPPSRAYLKLEEALIRLNTEKNILPGEGERCLDAGACPGGWTWVLRRLGCTVTAVDRSELAPSLMSDPDVTFIKHDAFTLPIEELGSFDWIFSDVICYPERLLSWVKKWIESGKIKNMVCTIKLQGEQNWSIIDEFASIPGSSVVHLVYNKHELTWMYTS